MLRKHDWALDCQEGHSWDPGASQGMCGFGHEHQCSLLAALSGVLLAPFSGLISAPGAIYMQFLYATQHYCHCDYAVPFTPLGTRFQTLSCRALHWEHLVSPACLGIGWGEGL